MWCPTAHPHHCGCPPVILDVWCPPLLVVMAVWCPPSCCCGVGAPLLVLVTVGASHSFLRLWVRTCLVSPQPLNSYQSSPLRCLLVGLLNFALLLIPSVVVILWWWWWCDKLSKERLHTILGCHLMIWPIDRPHCFLFEGLNFKFRSNDLFRSWNDPWLLEDGIAVNWWKMGDQKSRNLIP